jgi:hypothetical protein
MERSNAETAQKKSKVYVFFFNFHLFFFLLLGLDIQYGKLKKRCTETYSWSPAANDVAIALCSIFSNPQLEEKTIT